VTGPRHSGRAERVYDRRVAGRSSIAIAVTAAALVAARPGLAGAPPARKPAPPPAPAPAIDSATVALLPLATGKGFELYGQPVASEIARALRAGGIEVVVVSAGAPVPARAHLVIDGKIAAGERGAVALQVRVRDPQRGAVVATLDASAPELGALDRAAADLAARLLPAVKDQLVARERTGETTTPLPVHPERGPEGAESKGPARPEPSPVRPERGSEAAESKGPAAIAYGTSIAPEFPDTIAAELAHRLVARSGHRAIDAIPLDGKPLAGDFGLAIEVQSFAIEEHGVLTARASARIRVIAADGRVVADHVARTDTLVGSRTDDRAAMVRHCAAQLADIIGPRIAAWTRSVR
jgi:hypothetical protein